MEDSRKKVDELSGGRVGYVYIPDTQASGYTNFNRYYFSQVGKDAVVLDERFNHGGQIADYIVDILKLDAASWAPTTREGEDVDPAAAGDLRAEGHDRQPDVRARAATRCRGSSRRRASGRSSACGRGAGSSGIGGYPRLIDGGGVTAPRWALYGTNGRVGGREPRHRARRRGRAGPGARAPGPRSPARTRGRSSRSTALAKNPPPKLEAAAVPRLRTAACRRRGSRCWRSRGTRRRCRRARGLSVRSP